MIDDRNSMFFWYPLIKDLSIPQPSTLLVECPELLTEANRPVLDDVFPEVQEAAHQIGYHIFLRTDLMSGKYDWNRTCLVASDHELKRNMRSLCETSWLCDILGRPVRGFAIREYIDMDWKFKAFNGLPISRERRYFVRDSKVECHHPYWPENAIRFWSTDEPTGWQQKLRILSVEPTQEVNLLTYYAEDVGNLVEGYWSVDFCCGADGAWYLIDMALGEHSWHPEHQDVEHL